MVPDIETVPNNVDAARPMELKKHESQIHHGFLCIYKNKKPTFLRMKPKNIEQFKTNLFLKIIDHSTNTYQKRGLRVFRMI